MSKSCAILQSNYVPWKGYFDLINSVDEFIIYDTVQYTRRDWRNRNKIKTQAGTKWITIPVEAKGNYYAPINSIKVSDKSWCQSHISSLISSYKKTNYFDEYMPKLTTIYKTCEKEDYLSSINQLFIQKICEILGIKTKITRDKDYDISGDKNERLLNLCKQVNADLYLSGPAAQSYLDEELFEKSGVDVAWMDYSEYPEYEQVFPPFEHGVTVLDLLFCLGPETVTYMKSFKNN